MIYKRKERKDKPKDSQIYVCLCVSKFNEHQSEFYQLAAYDKEADRWTCETKAFTVVGWLSLVTDMKQLSEVVVELDYDRPSLDIDKVVEQMREANPYNSKSEHDYDKIRWVAYQTAVAKLKELLNQSNGKGKE